MRLPRLPLVTALALLFFFAYITGIRLAYSLLYARTLGVAGSRSVVVYPVVRPVGALDALAPSTAGDEQVRGRVLDIQPNATTIREYVPTDSVKRIHWASSARLARLMSRSFETREGGDAWIVLDLQASVHAGEAPESTLEYAMSLAASIADAALRRGSAIGLVSNDSRLSVIEAARGDQQQKKLFEHFTLAQADGTVSLANLLTSQRNQWRHRGGLIVITPSSDEHWLEALLDLGVRGQRSLVVYLDPSGFGRSQPPPAPAGRWRQALEWGSIPGASDLEPVAEAPLG